MSDVLDGSSVVTVIDWKLTNPDVCVALLELHRDLAAPSDLVCDELRHLAGKNWARFLESGLQQDGVSVAVMRMDRHYFSPERYSLGKMNRKFWLHASSYDAAIELARKWAGNLNQQELADYQQVQIVADALIGRGQA